MNKYDDIINLPHHKSTKYPSMSNYDRAAQFSPFAALVGHDEAIKETARQTTKKIELSEYEKSILDEKMQDVISNINTSKIFTFEYFVPDKFKEGGEYTTIANCIKNVDVVNGVIILRDYTIININDIIDITD